MTQFINLLEKSVPLAWRDHVVMSLPKDSAEELLAGLKDMQCGAQPATPKQNSSKLD